MKIKYAHQLGQQEAARRINYFLNHLTESQQYPISNVSGSWNAEGDLLDFSFLVQGRKIMGQVHCQNEYILLEADLPFPIRLFQAKIEDLIRGKLNESFN